MHTPDKVVLWSGDAGDKLIRAPSVCNPQLPS
jgi:hypothetical protein